jgi:hypothetical protein
MFGFTLLIACDEDLLGASGLDIFWAMMSIASYTIRRAKLFLPPIMKLLMNLEITRLP